MRTMRRRGRHRTVVPMRKRLYLGLIVVAILLLALGGLVVRSASAGVRTVSGA